MAGPDVSDAARRTRELRSLYSTARALAALGDLHEVLTTIVREARSLIGTDVAYLSTYEDGEIVLRAVDGSITDALRRATASATTGISGRVLQTSAPAWVEDYLGDSSLAHEEGFDSVVREEGISALLGVPVLEGDTLRGVLFAGDRSRRKFTPEEVALFSTFADHASVSLRNARLYQESQDALAKLQHAYRTIEENASAVERASQVHEALTRTVLEGGQVEAVISTLCRALDGEALVVDATDAVASHGPSALSLTTGELGQAIQDSRDAGRCTVRALPDGSYLSATPILAGDHHLGTLLHRGRLAPNQSDIRILERGAQVLGLLILQQNATAAGVQQSRDELLNEVLASRGEVSADTLVRATTRGWQLPQFTSLACVAVGSAANRNVAASISAELGGEQRCLVGQRDGYTLVLAQVDDPAELAALTYRAVSAKSPEAVVVACEFSVLHQPSHTGSLAVRCAALLWELGVRGRGMTTAELEPYALIFDPLRQHDLERFLDSTLGPVLEWDLKHDGNLMPTIAAYFAEGHNRARAAARAYVHVNTLSRRLQRVSGILGPDWDKFPRSTPLQLAIELHRLTNSAPFAPDGAATQMARGDLGASAATGTEGAAKSLM